MRFGPGMSKYSAMNKAPTQTRKMLPPELGAIIEFLDGEEKGRQVPLLYYRTVIGRMYGDVLIRDLKASSTHAAIDIKKDGFWITDLESSNGTFVRGKKIKQAFFKPDDEIRIGLTKFKVILNPQLSQRLAEKQPGSQLLREGGLRELIQKEFLADVKKQSGQEKRIMFIVLEIIDGPMKGKRITQPIKDSFVLGRLKADVTLNDPDVSRKHALIERGEGGQVILRDLSSRNGTYVNNQKISNTILHSGDRILIGTTVAICLIETQ